MNSTKKLPNKTSPYLNQILLFINSSLILQIMLLLLLKNKLKPFIKEKTINDYTFEIDEEQIIISTEPGVSPKELIGEYTYETTIVWFNNNFEF